MLYAIVTVVILILDQGLKYWTTLKIALDTGTRELIPGVIHLTNIHNTGAAFSILQNARWLLIVLTVVFVAAVIVMLAIPVIKGRTGRWMAILVMAGAIGNCIDRIFLGYVVDMLELEFISFPVFNLADVFITVGGIAFCLYIIFHKDYDESGMTAAQIAERDKVRRMHQKTVEQQRVANIDEISKDTGRFQAVRQTAEVAEVARTAEDARARSAHKHSPRHAAPAKTREPAPQRQQPAPQRQQPAPRPAARPERTAAIAFDTDDPFAEWERRPERNEDVAVSIASVKDPEDIPTFTPPVERTHAQRPKYEPAVSYTAPKYEPAVKYAAPAPKAAPKRAPAPAPKQAPAPKYEPAPAPAPKAEPAPEPKPAARPDDDLEFSLEDILAEFKD